MEHLYRKTVRADSCAEDRGAEVVYVMPYMGSTFAVVYASDDFYPSVVLLTCCGRNEAIEHGVRIATLGADVLRERAGHIVGLYL